MRPAILLIFTILAGCVTAGQEVKLADRSFLDDVVNRSHGTVADVVGGLDERARNRGFEVFEVPVQNFVLKAYRLTDLDRSAPLEVVLMPDFVSVAMNTSGGQRPVNINFSVAATDPQTLRSALADLPNLKRNVVVLHRPCYFIEPQKSPACESDAWWNDRRFSKTVVGALSQGIDELKRRFGKSAEPVHLIGASSGGLLALQVAAERSDIGSIRTVASAFDVVAVARHQRQPVLSDIPDLAALVSATKHIPQRHYSGSADNQLPAENRLAFQRRLTGTHCVSFETLSGGHMDGAVLQTWRYAVPGIPTCGQTAQAQ